VKATVSFANFDLDGRALVLRMSSYRGYYGCHYCEIAGEYSNNHVYYPVGVGSTRTPESYAICANAVCLNSSYCYSF
jgi:hypothetical protein